MAARLRASHQDDIREKIRAAQLVKFLEDHALGLKKPGKSIQTRIKAAEILLRKCIPDLAQTELSGAGGREIVVKVVSQLARVV